MLKYNINIKQFLERELAGETDVLGENPPQSHIVHLKSNMT
jgi:hypothetical protein